MSVGLATTTDEDMLRECLERLVPAILDKPTAITGIQRKPSDYSSSYHSDIITVQLDTGEKLKLFLKNFGFTRFPKDGAKQRRDRERGVYQDLLAGTDLGAAEYYGSVWDESQGTFWLLLEFVNGTEVRFCELEYWIAAAGWLGQLQGYFARHSDHLSACDFLIRHDADFFRSRAELALREISQISVPLADRLASILDRYDWIVDVMASQPRTLAHGHFRPCNIVADVNVEPVRICPVDWEQAAIGSALYDLTLISDGFEPPALDQLLEAYRHEAMKHGAAVPDREELRRVVACFRFFMAINLLSRARQRDFSEHKVTKIVDRLEKLHHRVIDGKANA
ncbi:MAG: phosphotransferase [Blastocatellia bacterium]